MSRYEEYEQQLRQCYCGGDVVLEGGSYGYPTMYVHCTKCNGRWCMETYSPEEAAQKWGYKKVYLHYWHFANQWYMLVNNNCERQRIPSHNECYPESYEYQEKNLILNSTGLTEREIKKYLTTKYPNYSLVKDIPYHEGRRWFGNKKGSRK